MAKPAPKSKGRKDQGNSIGIWIIGISAAVVLAVVLVIALNARQSSVAISAPDLPSEWIDRTTLGNPDAAVTVQIWEDFLCPACRQWNTQIEPKVVEDYIKTGDVRLEFHQFPLQSHAPGSQMAALASECAADENAFWPYHDKLFQAQDRGQAGYDIDSLVQYADELEMDSRALLNCMSSQTHRSDVEESFNQAIALGLNQTPSLLINGKLMESAFDYNAIQAEIDALLQAADSGY
jgi:protein-disulfide isomerase